MTEELYNKIFAYIDDAVEECAQDDIDSDLFLELYNQGLDLRVLVEEVWDSVKGGYLRDRWLNCR